MGDFTGGGGRMASIETGLWMGGNWAAAEGIARDSARQEIIAMLRPCMKPRLTNRCLLWKTMVGLVVLDIEFG